METHTMLIAGSLAERRAAAVVAVVVTPNRTPNDTVRIGTL